MVVLGIGWIGTNFFWGFNTGSLPLFLKNFTDSKFTISLVLSLGGLAGCIVPPIVGYLSDRSPSRFGRRRPYIFFGIFGVSLCIMALPWAPGLGIAALTAFIMYLAIGVVETPYMALLPDITPSEQRSTASGVMHLFAGIGLVAYFFFSSKIWDSHPTAVFYMVALVSFGSVMATVAIIKEPVAPENNASAWTNPIAYLKDVAQETNVLKFFIAQFFWWLGLLTVSPFATLFASEELGIPEGQAHLVLVAFSVSTMIFALPLGMLGDRFGRRGVLSCMIAIWAVAEFCVGFSQNLTQAVILVGITGIPFSAAMTVGYAYMLDLIPEERTAEFVGFNIVSIAATQLLGPLVGGKLIDTLGYRSIFPAAAAFMLTGMVILQLVRPRSRQIKG